MSDLSALELARRFAQVLDADDFAALAELLAPDCAYSVGGEILVGPAAILASYRAASAWARAHIDFVAYESSVRASPDGRAVVTFVDRLEHAGHRHEHRCEQWLSVGAQGRVRAIEHVDLPGEPEALRAFFAAAGIDQAG
jgi:ketosteroid isomerase-like protein